MVTTCHPQTPARFVGDYCALWFCALLRGSLTLYFLILTLLPVAAENASILLWGFLSIIKGVI